MKTTIYFPIIHQIARFILVSLCASFLLAGYAFSQVTPGSITPATITITSGGTVTLTHTGATGVTSRQWQMSTNNGVTWGAISGATSATYIKAIYNTNASDITYKVRVRINGQEIYSAESVIVITPAGGSVTPGSVTPATQIIASGASVALTHSGSTGVTARQWQQSDDNGTTWTDIPNATAATCNTGTLSNSGSSDLTRRYRVKVNGQALYSAVSVITVTGNTVNPGSITPASQTIASGGSVVVTHTGGTGITSRQWQMSTDGGNTWTNITDATSSTLQTIPLINDGAADIIYKARVQINGQNIYSAEAVVTVKGSGGGVNPGSITPASQTISSGSTVALTHTGSSGVTSRQWQYSVNNGTSWADLSGVTAETYNKAIYNNNLSDLIYKVRVKINGQALYSAETVITVTPAGGSVTPGSITPATQTVASGSSVTLTHTGSSGVTSRQWQTSYNGTYWTDVADATDVTCNSPVYNTGSSDLVYRIRVKINGQALYSAEAAITVTPAAGSVTPGSITPATQTVASGGSVDLTHSGGTGITSRQWQQSTDNGTSWTDIPNATAATCNTGALPNGGTTSITRKYRVKINGQAVYSAEAVITITPPGGSVNPGSITPATQTIASGGSVALTHSGSSGVTSRLWQYSTDNGCTWIDLTTATAANYSTGAIANGGSSAITRKYRVMINGQAVYSAESVITVNPTVVAGTITPATQTIASGGSVALTHSGSTGVTSRQWQQSDDNGATWADINSATAATHSTGAITNSGSSDITRKYRVKINGQPIYSAESIITVNPPVAAGTITPATQTIASGGSVALTHSGSSGVTSRLWQYSTDNGSTWTDLTTATAATYNTGALANNGATAITRKYRVKINGQAVYSAESVITVSAPVPVTPGIITPAVQAVASGGSLTLTHSGSAGVTSRQWQMSTNNGSTWTDIPGATAANYNTGTLANNGSAPIACKYRTKINNQAVYSAVSVITVNNSGSSGGGSGGDTGGGGSVYNPEGTISYMYDASGNRVIRNKIIRLQSIQGMTKSAVVDSGNQEEKPEVMETPTTPVPETYEDLLGERKVVIYPNPTKGMIRIEFQGYSDMKDARLLLYNMQGRLLRQINKVEPSATLDLSPYPAGMYILQMIEGNAKSDWKIIKEE